MTTSKELRAQAARALDAAREIRDRYPDHADVPPDAVGAVEKALADSKRLMLDADLVAAEEKAATPQYTHSMTYGGDADGYGAKGSDPTAPARYEMGQPRAFGKWLAGVATGQVKAALVEDSTSGGVNIVPADFAGVILKDMPRNEVIRNLAMIRPTNSDKVSVGSVVIAQAGWGPLELTGSTTTDGLGATPVPANDDIFIEDLTALVLLGNNEIEDVVGLQETVQAALGSKLAEQEDDAFAFGSGHTNKQPTGIAYGSTVTQGSAAAAGQTLLADDITSLAYKVPSWAQRNGVYLANSSVTAAAMLIKDSDGHYMWEPAVAAGQPATWRGRPWYSLDGLPAMNATTDAGAGTNTSLVFGDVRQGYMIADRRTLRVQVLRERYAEQGKTGLLFTLRVGGGIVRPKAFARHLL